MNTEADNLRRRLSSVLVALRCHDDCPQCAAEIPLIEREIAAHDARRAQGEAVPYVDVVFDGPPGPEPGRFVEVENAAGASIRFGEWIHRPDGYWALRIPAPQPTTSAERAQQWMGDPDRYFMEHGMIHDRHTGQHVSTDESTHPGGTRELFGRLRSYERMVHGFPRLSEFFSKHGMGSKLAPSCFGCGAEFQSWDGCTQHLELPDIFLCPRCAAAITAVRASEGALEKFADHAEQQAAHPAGSAVTDEDVERALRAGEDKYASRRPMMYEADYEWNDDDRAAMRAALESFAASRLDAATPAPCVDSGEVQHGPACDSGNEREDCDRLRMRMSNILTRTANALKGEPKPLRQHSWHDLPEVAAILNSPNRGHVYYNAGDPDCPRSIKAPNGEVHTLMCKHCALKHNEARHTYCAGAVARALAASPSHGTGAA